MQTKTIERDLENSLTQTIETKEIERKYKDKILHLKTKELTISGKDISLRIPGARGYEGIERIEVEYHQPMKVELRGKVIELPNEKAVESKDLTAVIEAERINETEMKFDKRKKAVHYITDPEIKIYTAKGIVVLNQVHGIPKINLKEGIVRYK